MHRSACSRSKRRSRVVAVSFFESSSSRTSTSGNWVGSRIAAPATTGPAQGPRPASSMPAITAAGLALRIARSRRNVGIQNQALYLWLGPKMLFQARHQFDKVAGLVPYIELEFENFIPAIFHSTIRARQRKEISTICHARRGPRLNG